jgi:hypothetical protein
MTEPTPGLSNTSSDPDTDPDVTAGVVAGIPQDWHTVGELTAIRADDHHTLYVLPDDVVLLPCGPNWLPAVVGGGDGMKELHDYLEVTQLVVTPGITEPWILRKATTQPE